MNTGYIENWFKYRCPECKTINWILCAEDNEDADVEGIECHTCKHEWIIIEDEVWLEEIARSDGPNCTKGQATPY